MICGDGGLRDAQPNVKRSQIVFVVLPDHIL